MITHSIEPLHWKPQLSSMPENQAGTKDVTDVSQK